ncbi:MAG: DUF502 domain-containing protein [candidate division Zixibacteria bacterium]|nr:DUF502 domain-containing protein [candidate division Zixibacteria bacterium]
MSILRVMRDIIKRQFLSGVLVVVPLILTYLVLRFLFETVDGILSPLIFKLLGYSIPGLGIIATVLIILLMGIVTRNLVGAKLYGYGDKMLTKTPLIRIIYSAAKQLIEAVSVPNIKTFKEVVMIEYPRQGLYAVGFATAKIKFQGGKDGDKKLVGVFIPSTPTPMTGMVVFIAEEDVICMDITVEEGIKLIVSGGIVSPQTINLHARRTIGEA